MTLRLSFAAVAAAAAVAAVVGSAVPTAVAQDDPCNTPGRCTIEFRQSIMEANGNAARLIVAMLRKQVPYDAAIVATAMETIGHDNKIFPTLFPAGTETGSDTEAKAEIWSDNAGFVALSNKMATDAAAAAALAGGDQAAFIAAFKVVSDNCTACHEKYRTEQN